MPKPYSNYRDLVNSKPLKPAPWKAFPSAWDTGGPVFVTRVPVTEASVSHDARDPLKSNLPPANYANAVASPRMKKSSVEEFSPLKAKLEEEAAEKNSGSKLKFETWGGPKTWNSSFKLQEWASGDVEDGWNAPDVPSESSSRVNVLNEKIMQWNDSGALEAYLKSTSYNRYPSQGSEETTNLGFNADREPQLNSSTVDSLAAKASLFTREVVWSPKGNHRSKAALLPDSAEAMLNWKEPTASRRRRKRGNQPQFDPDPAPHPSTESKIKLSEPPMLDKTQPLTTAYPPKLNATHPNHPSSTALPPAVSSSMMNSHNVTAREHNNPKYFAQAHQPGGNGVNGINASNYAFPAVPQLSTSHETRPVLNSRNKDYKPQMLDTRPWATTAPYVPSPEWFPKPSTGPLLRKTAYQNYAKVDVNPCIQFSQSNSSSAPPVDSSMGYKSMSPVWKSSFMQKQNQEKQANKQKAHSNGSHLGVGYENKKANQDRVKTHLVWQPRDVAGNNPPT